MCFCVDDGVVEKTATEDIVVWKTILKNNQSVVFSFRYDENRLYRLRQKLVIEDGYEINNGFHSYIRHQGKKDGYRKNVKFVKMIIPKGAKYYEDGSERVSTSIRTLDLKHIPYTSREAKS